MRVYIQIWIPLERFLRSDIWHIVVALKKITDEKVKTNSHTKNSFGHFYSFDVVLLCVSLTLFDHLKDNQWCQLNESDTISTLWLDWHFFLCLTFWKLDFFILSFYFENCCSNDCKMCGLLLLPEIFNRIQSALILS